MVTFTKMVITRIKNGSPDMIPTAFEAKFDENKNDHKLCPRGSPWARIWHVPYYHTPKEFVMPKGGQI